MTYRRVRKEDLPKIQEMCAELNVEYDIERTPLIGFVAVGDEGQLIGFVFAHAVALIEPFISKNPTAAVKLQSQIEGAISALNFQTVLAHIGNSNEKMTSEIVRAGYELIDKRDYSFYKKVNNG